MGIKNLLPLVAMTLTLAAHGQTPEPKSEPKPEPQETKVAYRGTWEIGELKDCVTQVEESGLLLCDGNKILDKQLECMERAVGTHANPAQLSENCHKEAVRDVRLDSKSFMVKFSEKPWPRTDKKGWWFKCGKGEVISCSREEIPR